MQEPKRSFLIATDWHGNADQAREVIFEAERKGIDTIVHLGDFGIKESSHRYLGTLQRYLEFFNIRLYFIDGNHERFSRIFQKEVLSDGTCFVCDNIFYLPRGLRWSWQGVSFMALGGAGSINRFKPGSGSSHWDDNEFITDKDVEKAISGGPVDVMFMHDSPADAPNELIDSADEQMKCIKTFGLTSVMYTYAHREQLRQVTNAVNPRFLFHGHYHRYMHSTYKHQESGMHAKIWGLDQGSVPLNTSRSTFVFDFYQAKHGMSRLKDKDKKYGTNAVV